ncbi:hypothetical protein ACNPQK_15000 [Acinetobacter guillouiae]|jgi:hypothetical protein|uniref:hypothetical protein n=1 Tax=Acinetobacter guillouiae TaxID=106649 RepID=UPI003AF9F42B
MNKLILASLMGFCVLLNGCSDKNKAIEINNNAEIKESSQSDVVSIAKPSPEIKPEIITPEPTSNWNYNQKNDDMRGIITKFASISSDNRVQFDFPYNGGSYLDITLRKRATEPTEIMFTINDGQYSCDTISESCFASVKFDDGHIQNIELSATTDYSGDVLFISNDYDVDTFIKSLKKSKKLIIELPFYQEGKKQFSFTVSGINWGKGE